MLRQDVPERRVSWLCRKQSSPICFVEGLRRWCIHYNELSRVFWLIIPISEAMFSL